METQGSKRVVLRANGGRRHLNVGRDIGQPPNNATFSLDTTESTPCDLTQPLTVQSPPHSTQRCRTPISLHTSGHRVPAELCNSTPLHLSGSRHGSSSSSSSSPSLTHSTGHKHVATARSQGEGVAGKAGKIGKRRWRKGKRVHPVSYNSEASTFTPSHHQPPPTLSGPPETGSGHCLQSPALLPPTTDLSYSLPPLLSSQLRKGGRRPSASVDWRTDGSTELERYLPGRRLRVYVGTWNMQQLSVSESFTSSHHLPSSSCPDSS